MAAVTREKFSFRFYEPGIEREILRLRRSLKEILAIDKNTSDYWFHENFKNPAGESVISMVFDGDRLVSHFVLMPRVLRVFGRPVSCYQCVEVMTDPAYRGRGLLRRAGVKAEEEAVRRGAEVILGFPNARSRDMFLGRFRWRKMLSVPLLFLPMKPAGLFLRRPVRGFLELLAGGFAAPSRGRRSAVEISCFDDSLEELVRRCGEKYGILFQRDMEWLSWRYCSVPGRTYRIFKLPGVDPAAFCVLRTTKLGRTKVVVVMDVCSEAGGEDTVGFLREALRAAAGEGGAIAALAMAPVHALQYKMLRETGFIPVPERVSPYKILLAGRQTDLFSSRAGGGLFDPDGWQLGFGDNDVF